MKECLLYKKLKNKAVQCEVCRHNCLILPGCRGVCGVRKNNNGQLNLLVYGHAASIGIDPIEKKPLFHFYPGSQTYSIAAIGCNFRCTNCQNWEISQASKQTEINFNAIGQQLTPRQAVSQAQKYGCQSISYTYTEPTIWLEYALDTMKLAKKQGLKNIWVSNGYMSKKTLDLIIPYLDAINIDIKFFENSKYQKICGGQLDPILENLKIIKKSGIWIETTTLVIPTLSDDKKTLKNIADFIKKQLSPKTPWHISAFSPYISYNMKEKPPTTADMLKNAYNIGKKSGLKYVYIGNYPELDGENTFCPKCGKILIARTGYHIIRYDKHGQCPYCQTKLDIIG